MDVRKTIIKLFIFLLPIAVIWGFLEYKLAQIPNTYSQKKIFLEKQLDSVEVLAAGTSHIFYGVNPDYFAVRGFNIANVNQSLYYNKRITLKYLDRMPRLRMVIYEIGYFTLYYQIRNDNRERWRDYFYYLTWGIDYKDLPVWHMKRYSRVALYSPDIVKKYIAIDFKVDLAKGLAFNGFMPRDTLQPKDSAQLEPGNFQTRIQGLNKLIDTAEYRYNYEDLESFIAELRKRNIQVVLVTTPWLPQLYDLSNKQVFEQNEKDARELCRLYGCSYFNYLRDNRFNAKDFADPNHLNYRGAKKFSTIINEEIILPLLKH